VDTVYAVGVSVFDSICSDMHSQFPFWDGVTAWGGGGGAALSKSLKNLLGNKRNCALEDFFSQKIIALLLIRKSLLQINFGVYCLIV
jgi:hypothetical protein